MNMASSAGSYVASKPSLILPVEQVQVRAPLPDMGIVGMQCTVHRMQLLAVMCKVVCVSHTSLPGMAWCTAHRFTWDGMVHCTQVYLGWDGALHTGLPGMVWCTTHKLPGMTCTTHRFTWDDMVHYTQVYLG